jgi:replicative DNA helicase
MNELLLIKFFLNKDIYTRYRHLVGNELVQGDALILLTLLDDWFISNDKPISLDDLYFLALTRFTREQADLLFQSLRALEPSETINTFLEDLNKKHLLEQISLASYEAANGKNVTHKLHDLFDQLGNVKVEDKECFIDSDLSEILDDTVKEPGLRWRLKTLNRMLGSLRAGDFGFFVARPETGKTTMLASEVSFMAEQLREDQGPILWFNNEEQGKKVKLRVYQAALGSSLSDLLKDPRSADSKYLELTHGKIKIYDNAVTHKKVVESLSKKYKPSLIIFDQIDKVQGFTSDREDLRLGAIYQWARELAKTHNCPVIGVSQAAGEAEDTQWLNMGHVSNSKTAKQAEADWIVGIGKLEDPSYNKVRYISVMKNKLMGDSDTEPVLRHGKMEVIIEPQIARYLDIT